MQYKQTVKQLGDIAIDASKPQMAHRSMSCVPRHCYPQTRQRSGVQVPRRRQSKREWIQYVPEISAGGAELAEQAAADVVAVEKEELVQAGACEAGDGGILEASAVEAQAPQARVQRQQRAQ